MVKESILFNYWRSIINIIELEENVSFECEFHVIIFCQYLFLSILSTYFQTECEEEI